MKLFPVCLLLLLISCDDRDPFYTAYVEEDLYRMPVIKPYQLTHLYGIEEGDEHDLWELGLVYGGDKETIFHLDDPNHTIGVPAKEINVSNGIIYGHRGRNENGPGIWFVVIPNEKIEKVFIGKELEWKDYLKQKGVDSTNMYSVWALFREYKKSHTLPWYNPAKGIYPDKKSSD